MAQSPTPPPRGPTSTADPNDLAEKLGTLSVTTKADITTSGAVQEVKKEDDKTDANPSTVKTPTYQSRKEQVPGTKREPYIPPHRRVKAATPTERRKTARQSAVGGNSYNTFAQPAHTATQQTSAAAFDSSAPTSSGGAWQTQQQRLRQYGYINGASLVTPTANVALTAETPGQASASNESQDKIYERMDMSALAKRAKKQAGDTAPKHTKFKSRKSSPGQASNSSPRSREDDDVVYERNADSITGDAGVVPGPLPKKKPPPPKILPRPEPSSDYLQRALREPQFVAGTARKLLVVLDLNGTVLHREGFGGTNFISRPRVHEFLHYLLTNHKLMIWSSAQPFNVNGMCKQLFTEAKRNQLVAVWARDTLRLTPAHYKTRLQVYKQLSWVWNDAKIAATCVDGEVWGQHNTVLIDDSEEKAASEPFNLLKIDEFFGTQKQKEMDVLGQVVQYLERLRSAVDVSAATRNSPFHYQPCAEPFDWRPIVEDMQRMHKGR